MSLIVSEVSVRKDRWRRFMAGQSEHRYLYLIRCETDSEPRPLPWPDLVKQRINWAWNRYCRQVEQATWLEDDTIPYLDPYTGTEIFAEAFGCEAYRPTNDQPSARP